MYAYINRKQFGAQLTPESTGYFLLMDWWNTSCTSWWFNGRSFLKPPMFDRTHLLQIRAAESPWLAIWRLMEILEEKMDLNRNKYCSTGTHRVGSTEMPLNYSVRTPCLPTYCCRDCNRFRLSSKFKLSKVEKIRWNKASESKPFGIPSPPDVTRDCSNFVLAPMFDGKQPCLEMFLEVINADFQWVVCRSRVRLALAPPTIPAAKVDRGCWSVPVAMSTRVNGSRIGAWVLFRPATWELENKGSWNPGWLTAIKLDYRNLFEGSPRISKNPIISKKQES